MKYDLYWTLIEAGIYVDMEKIIGSTRTDILAEINGHILAIEIQNTPIPIKSIIRRMREHYVYGAYTLWLINEDLIQPKKYPRNLKWLNFIQAIQNGVLFLPTGTSKIIPARIDNSLILKSNRIVVDKKFLLKTSPIELDELQFEKNYAGLNTVTVDEWWLRAYAEII